MSWAKNLCNTYDACVDVIGKIEDKNENCILLPLGHSLKQIDVIVHLESNGIFQRAEQIKSSKEKKMFICIPCTEESEGRSSSGASKYPHPLFDQIKYIRAEKYRKNLKRWLTYLGNRTEHALAYLAISAVYNYILKETLINDLKTYKIINQQGNVNDNLFIGFCVSMEGVLETKLWRMPELWKAWSSYYLDEDIKKREKKDICYISGSEHVSYTEKHPKSINRAEGNAKLISGNDDKNFTFLGRFEESAQAVTVSYEASQKMHQTLRWLISGPNCYRCGSQAIVAWAIDAVPKVACFYEDSYGIYNTMTQSDAADLTLGQAVTYVDYARALRNAITGYSASDLLKKRRRRIAIMVVDCATKGRMSVTYYRELTENEYEERISLWHDTCKWYQLFDKNEVASDRLQYFIGAPSMNRIVLAVLGKRRSQKDESYNKLVKNLREQLVHCVFDGKRIPRSLVVAALNRASNPIALENTSAQSVFDRWRDWEYALGAACALIKRYYHDYKEEEFAVKLETERCDRDYLFGRLLAVADQIESLARFKQKNAKEDARATNAIRYMTVFSQHPFRTWNLLFTQLLNPYIQQLNGAGWYLNLLGEINQLFEANAFEDDTPLDGRYLLGFFAQRQELHNRTSSNDKNGGKKNEFTKQN